MTSYEYDEYPEPPAPRAAPDRNPCECNGGPGGCGCPNCGHPDCAFREPPVILLTPDI